jgi:hypothetical protein
VVVALIVAGAVGLIAVSSTTTSGGSSSGSSGSQLKDPLTPGQQQTDGTSAVASPIPVDPAENVRPFQLNASGVRDFLAVYHRKFGTTKVTDLTMYDDYVVVDVPVPGKHRHAGWIYRDGSFADFGGVTADFPGSVAVDTRKLDVAALVRNLAKARRTLHVDQITQSYVIVNYRPDFDQAPNVNIYVSNDFHESGYLATHLDGSFERAYPFAN